MISVWDILQSVYIILQILMNVKRTCILVISMPCALTLKGATTALAMKAILVKDSSAVSDSSQKY